jgi:hypothetical protein
VDGESLRQICRDPQMPSKTSVMRWLAAHKSFSDQYARARLEQAEGFADEILEIADDSRNDWIEREFGRGNVVEVPDREVTDRSKLRVDARKWLMSKMLPKKYGEAVLLKGDKDNPLQLAGVIVVPKKDVATASPVAAQPKAG